MAFAIKTWVNRLSEFPNRRKLDSTGITDTYDVTRSEGTVSVEGDKIDAANLNDLEQRISDGFVDTVQSATIDGAAVTKNGTELQLPAYPVIPTALKNPNALTIAVGNGGTTGTYDGSAAKTVSIPKVTLSTTATPSYTLAVGELYFSPN